MLKNRFQVGRSYAFAWLSVLAVAAACGSTKTTFNDPPAGGSGGESGWTFLPPGNGTGGAGSVAGNASGGRAGHAGVAGFSGSGGAIQLPPVTFNCGGKQPNQPVITSFDAFMADRWNSPGNLDGGVYVYPDALKPKAGEFLRFEDLVKTFTGMGVWFSGCIDAAKFSGVRFTISGDAGMSGNVQFYVISNRDKEVDEVNRVGACVPDDPNNTWLNCRPPAVTLPVSAAPTEQSIRWSAFEGGLPTAKTDGSDLLALQWSFTWVDGAIPYAGQLTIDDLEFFDDEGQGGAGGAGGMPSETGNEGGVPSTPGSGGQGGL